ncbi:transposase [Salibacterium aidingense]|uniref:transposase n=1 Tax=Salibacterium aidingense TaxID=384933 RepID=UPI003BBE41A2
MPRMRRIWYPDYFYHIVSRGNRRDPLFRHKTDFEVFLHILHQTYEKAPFELSSYCLMTNHYHLQMRAREQSISKVMALLNKRYANYYNTRYELSGHVFEKRFFSSRIRDEEGMMEVRRYIHDNPVEARLVKKPEHYPWSSFRFYHNPQLKPPIFLSACHHPDIVE